MTLKKYRIILDHYSFHWHCLKISYTPTILIVYSCWNNSISISLFACLTLNIFLLKGRLPWVLMSHACLRSRWPSTIAPSYCACQWSAWSLNWFIVNISWHHSSYNPLPECPLSVCWHIYHWHFYAVKCLPVLSSTTLPSLGTLASVCVCNPLMAFLERPVHCTPFHCSFSKSWILLTISYGCCNSYFQVLQMWPYHIWHTKMKSIYQSFKLKHPDSESVAQSVLAVVRKWLSLLARKFWIKM